MHLLDDPKALGMLRLLTFNGYGYPFKWRKKIKFLVKIFFFFLRFSETFPFNILRYAYDFFMLCIFFKNLFLEKKKDIWNEVYFKYSAQRAHSNFNWTTSTEWSRKVLGSSSLEPNPEIFYKIAVVIFGSSDCGFEFRIVISVPRKGLEKRLYVK